MTTVIRQHNNIIRI